MRTYCLDNSKSDFYYYHVIVKEEERCFINTGIYFTYLCYFGKWAKPRLDNSSSQIVYDLIDQLYCSNSDYEGSYANSLYALYMRICIMCLILK